MSHSQDSIDWVVCAPPGAVCKRCGAEWMPPPLPLLVMDFVRATRVFIEQHRHCLDPNVPEEDGPKDAYGRLLPRPFVVLSQEEFDAVLDCSDQWEIPLETCRL